MKIKNNSKYVLYIILFIIFIVIRINHVLLSGEIEEISFRSLAISHCSYPFGIIKSTALYDNVLPFYYFIIGILRNDILIKIFNTIISLLNVYLFVIIGKKILNEKLGIFLGIFLSLNHFFLYYSNLIAPYCLIFLVQTLLINSLIDYLKKPNERHFKNLNIFNCLLILVDSFGFLYVLSELLILNILGKRKKIYKKLNLKLFYPSFFTFLIVFPILITQYIIKTKFVIPINYNGIGFNLNALYLILSEYITPYLSFSSPEYQNQSILGMLYSYFLNPTIKNINSLKILITLFYSSILPLILIGYVAYKAYKKNYRLRLIFLSSIVTFLILIFLMIIEKIDVQPIYMTSFFITIFIMLGYGIFLIKDNLIKNTIIACLLLIQVINPEINAFDVTINKNYALLNPINKFFNEKQINKNDLILMPYKGKLASFYFKKLNFYDYDEDDLKKSYKNSLITNLSNKKAKKISQKNISYLMKNYLMENKLNTYIVEDFIKETFTEPLPERVILIVDKLNSKPISQNSILKAITKRSYNNHPKKIDYKYLDLSQNESKILFDAIKTKTLYNLVELLNTNFKLNEIIEYKKIDNEYYRIQKNNNIYHALSSFDSDYAFIIFK